MILERVRQWLEDRGVWYGRMKPCDCPRSERYWGLNTHPPECVRVDDGARRTERETEAARIVEWKATRTWRCRNCGECFQQEMGAVVERDVEWKQPQGEQCPEVPADA